MYRLSLLVLAGSLLLSACGGGGTPAGPADPLPPSGTVFTPEHAWSGTLPQDAEMLDADEFQRRVLNGEVVLVGDHSASEQQALSAEQFQRDRNVLEAIPASGRTPAIQNLLDQAAQPGDPLAEPEFVFNRAAPGTTGTATLVSLASSFRNAVTGLERSQSLENALSAYQTAYQNAPADLVQELPTPERLQGQPLADIVAARDRLEGVLSQVDLEQARPEAGAGRGSLTANDVSGGVPVKAGTGSDGAACGPRSVNGIYTNFWWPLKRFITPVRNQGRRGTCWTFAGVAALESREMVVNDKTLNLSEQFLAHREKLLWARDDLHDGDSPWSMLSNAVKHAATIPPEAYWTYNPAPNRPNNAFQADDPATAANEQVEGTPASYKDACKEYAPTGTCSESSHQSPLVCTKFPLIGQFCGYAAVQSSPTGVSANALVTLWSDYHDPKTATPVFPLATLKTLLRGGVAVVARLQVNSTFNAGKDGFLTSTSEAFGGGGHFVLIVGYVSNATLASRLPNAPKGAGGGYFIVKNSWGCDDADGGFRYVPVDYVKKYFTDLGYLDMPTTRSDRWQEEVQQGSKVTVTTPTAGKILKVGVPNTFKGTVQSLATGGTEDCALLAWRTDRAEDGFQFGCQPTFTFKSEGPRRIRATYIPKSQFAYAEVGVQVLANTAPAAIISSPAVGASYQASDPISLAGKVGDREDGALVYAWRLILNPGTSKEIQKDLFAGTVTETLSAAGATVNLPVQSFRLSDVGAVCESAAQTYRLELFVTDGFLSSSGKDTTVSRTIFKGSCKP